MLEDTLVNSPLALNRSRRLGLALFLFAVPACGLTDYETLMREAQERHARFEEEKNFLDSPVQIPETEKDNKKVPLVNVFFRPPKGIQSKPQQLDDLRWRYPAYARSSDFIAVDLAFAEDNKGDFSRNICEKYGIADRSPDSPRQITPPGQKTAMAFDVWEFVSGENGYSVNVLKGSAKPVAIVYVYNKARRDSASKLIELSLQSLGVDLGYGAARQRYDQKSPWKLQS